MLCLVKRCGDTGDFLNSNDARVLTQRNVLCAGKYCRMFHAASVEMKMASSRAGQREFQPAQENISEESKKNQFRAVSYNILANSYAYESYVSCNLGYLV